VVKADGLALGTGAIVCGTLAEAEDAISKIMVERAFGDAGDSVVIQEFLEGVETSLHAFCDGSSYRLFPASQDHKQAYDGDKGPNTGGMGAYSPAPFFSTEELDEATRTILDPWLEGCRKEGVDYRGLLYPGIMLTADGPKVIEFNSRFGDPETQVYLPRLENDLVDVFEACIDGRLSEIELRWSEQATLCVVLASGGDPGKYEKGKTISGLEEAEQATNVKVFHAGTKRGDTGRFETNGGRVLGVTAWADTLEQAKNAAYAACDVIDFEEKMLRRDIGAKALS
jgi:phosphoribosylamine--glycine ligase